MSAKSNVDFFGSYLSRVSESDGEATAEGADLAVQPEHKVIEILTKFGRPVPIKALMSITFMPPSLIMKTLDNLREARLIDMASTDSEETVAITELGQKIFGVA
ncbi:MAG: hypothetical protein ACJ8EB_06445 [Allosphingosinicella sp.]